MKKLLATILAQVMALGLCSVSWAADCTGDDNCTIHVAKIGTTHYTTLAEAVNASGDNALIELFADVTDGGGIIIGDTHKNITINFGGHTYTVTKDLAGSANTKNQCFQFLQGSESVKLLNGKIIGNNSGLSFIIQNYTNLTLKDMTLDATKGTNSIHTVVSNNCGEVNVIGSTSITAAAGKVALDVSFWPSAYPAGTSVTVDTTGTIKGRIDMGLWGKDGAIAKPSKSILVVKNVTHEGEMTVTNGATGYETGLAGETLTAMIKENVTVSGGTFSSQVNPTFLADGLAYEVRTSAGKYNYYSDYATAVAAAEAAGTTNEIVKVDRTTGDNENDDVPFTIDYADGSGKKVTIRMVKDNFELPTLTRSGYTFKGWKVLDCEGTQVLFAGPLSSEEVKSKIFAETAAGDGGAEVRADYSDGVTLIAVWSSNSYYYYPSTSDTTTSTTTKGSPKTFDAGVGIYAVTALLSVTGMAWAGKKRH